MADTPTKAPKKEKVQRQSAEDRLAALRYNHMMYGPTEGEAKLTPKKVNYGAPFLKHPKFQSLMTAFRHGGAFKFDITTDGRVVSISTAENHIRFDDKTLFYARALNKHEDNLFLDRAMAVQLQSQEPVVHLVFAVLRHFSELGEPDLAYQRHKFYQGNDPLEFATGDQANNLMLGPFKCQRPLDKAKK